VHVLKAVTDHSPIHGIYSCATCHTGPYATKGHKVMVDFAKVMWTPAVTCSVWTVSDDDPCHSSRMWCLLEWAPVV